MRLREILLDMVANSSIFEMAEERKSVIKKVDDLSHEILLHLVKCLMFGKSHHWCDEINAWLSKIQRIKCKHNNEPLDEVTLFKILFEQPLGHTTTAQEWMNDVWNSKLNGEYQYRKIPILQPDGREIHKQLALILKSVCNDISNSEYKDIEDYL